MDEIRKRQFAEDIAKDLSEGRLLELAELYALDALSDEERATVDAHLSAAPGAERHAFEVRVHQAREVLTVAYAPEEVEPPAHLLGEILGRLPHQDGALPAAVAPLAPQSPSAAAPVPHVSPSDSAPSDDLAARRAARSARTGWSTGRRWLTAAVAAVIIAFGGVAIGSNIAGNQDPARQILQASDLATRTASIPGGGTATLAVSAARDGAVVTMHDVPAPPQGKVYQMWLLPKDGSSPVSQGTMDAEALSKAATIRGVDAAAAFAITVEPSPGSAAPTTAPVATVSLGA
ncbi:MAG: hypothetical protein JWO93_1430 [Micrococcaceae bacterium]|jgi:hypothetical protein|nr:hypothetical protein [Micrococcaceae bacterium]